MFLRRRLCSRLSRNQSWPLAAREARGRSEAPNGYTDHRVRAADYAGIRDPLRSEDHMLANGGPLAQPASARSAGRTRASNPAGAGTARTSTPETRRGEVIPSAAEDVSQALGGARRSLGHIGDGEIVLSPRSAIRLTFPLTGA